MLIDPNQSKDAQIAKQEKIIDALIRRANKQKGMDFSAFSAFQSAMNLLEHFDAQSRDLERATTELESERLERQRTRKSLVEALSSMEEGLALFYEGKLEICNDQFRGLLPEIAEELRPGFDIEAYFNQMSRSRRLVSCDGRPAELIRQRAREMQTEPISSIILELTRDRWFQLSCQRTSASFLVLLLTDISSIVRRNRTERERLIDRQADYLQAMFESSSSGICTFSASGEIKMLNNRFRALLGVSFTVAQEGASLERLLRYVKSRGLVADWAALREKLNIRELKEHGHLNRRIALDHGKVLELQANMLPDGGFLVELKDVTLEARTTEMLEQRVVERTRELTKANRELTAQYETKARVEEELRIAKERAEQAVSSKTRFLAAASHDLLQPMNAAKLLISTLKGANRSAEILPFVDRLERAFGSTEYLLRSLLDISRLESLDPDAVRRSNINLFTILENVQFDQSLLAAQKGVTLKVVPSRIIVNSDPVYLLRSVQNLVANAIQYTKSGGRVLVGCRRRAGKVVVEVWDTGIGIAKADQERIFDEFARADAMGPGVGLGLSIVARTCRHLGHEIWVRSAPGIGSVFNLEMEIVGVGPADIAPQNTRSQHVDTPLDQIVLVIENDEDVLFATTTQLENWGASVLPAGSIREARQLVGDIGMPPDIILADYHLDGNERGTDAIADLRKSSGKNIPAIVITADQRQELQLEGARQNFAVLTKPVDIAQLKPLIERKLQRKDAPPHQAPTKVGDDRVV